MLQRALGVELYTPILLCEKLTTEIVILKVNCSDQEAEHLLRNVMDGIDTNTGKYSVLVSDDKGNPLNPQRVMIDLKSILTVWKR